MGGISKPITNPKGSPMPHCNTGRTFEDIWPLADVEFFKKGACHALALELHDAFVAAGKTAEFYYFPNADHPGIAEHVVVKSRDGYFDVDFGPQSEDGIIARWKEKTAGHLKRVDNPGWLCCLKRGSQSDSYLALHVVPEHLEEMRNRARAFIQQHKAKFGL